MNRNYSDRPARGGQSSGGFRNSGRPTRGRPPKRRSAHSTPKEPDPRGERLQKVLASAGIGSRRDCEELISAGRVEVDRQVVTVLGTRVHAESQEIRVDGTILKKPKKHYFLINKPVGVVTTNFDPSGRPRVIDLAPTQDRVFAVGRLDRSSEGLILVTNDGDFANLLTHPRYGVPKTYLVRVAGMPTSEDLFKLRKGIYLSDGFCKIESIKIKSRHGQSTDLIMVLNEGKNREIRRVLARLGHKVVRLMRLSVGTLKLGELPSGSWRVLLPTEIEKLQQLARAEGPRAPREEASEARPSSKPTSAAAEGVAQEEGAEEATDVTENVEAVAQSDEAISGDDRLDDELAGLLSADDEDFSGAEFSVVDESELEEEFGTSDEWNDDSSEAPSPSKARESTRKPKKPKAPQPTLDETANLTPEELAMMEESEDDEDMEMYDGLELAADAEEIGGPVVEDFDEEDFDELLGGDFEVSRGEASAAAGGGDVLDYNESGEDAGEPEEGAAPRPPRDENRGRSFDRDRGPRGGDDRGPRGGGGFRDRGPGGPRGGGDRGGDRRGNFAGGPPRNFGDRPRFGGPGGGRDDRGPRGGDRGFAPRGDRPSYGDRGGPRGGGGGGFAPRGDRPRFEDRGGPRGGDRGGDRGGYRGGGDRRSFGPPSQDRFPRREVREFDPSQGGFDPNAAGGPPAEGGEGGPPRGDRGFAPRGDRPRFGDRGGPRGGDRGGDRGFAPRGDRPRFGDRGRDDRGGDRGGPRGGDRGFAPRGDRPQFGDRSGPRGGGGGGFAPRGDRPQFGGRGRDDRGGPRGDRGFSGPREGGGDRGFAPRGDRPSYGDRGGPRSGGGGGFAPRGDRPQFGGRGRDDRGGAPRGDGPRGDGRPRREEFGGGGSRGRTGGGGFGPPRGGSRFGGGDRGRPSGPPRGGFNKGRGRDGDRS